MRAGVLLAVLALALAGCKTFESQTTFDSQTGGDPILGTTTAGGAADARHLATPSADASASLIMPAQTDFLGLGKYHFRAGNFGLAEQNFRTFLEQNAHHAEGWMGLAASYDQLRRFDLADRAYKKAISFAGSSAEILNNQGYSHILRGDLRRARILLRAAAAKDPHNPRIVSNIALLEQRSRGQ